MLACVCFNEPMNHFSSTQAQAQVRQAGRDDRDLVSKGSKHSSFWGFGTHARTHTLTHCTVNEPPRGPHVGGDCSGLREIVACCTDN